jgi:hypothetical protein
MSIARPPTSSTQSDEISKEPKSTCMHLFTEAEQKESYRILAPFGAVKFQTFLGRRKIVSILSLLLAFSLVNSKNG